MSVIETDIKFLKSATITNGSANGGRKVNTEVLTGVRHNLFPRITAAERLAGLTRYRKEFWANMNANDEAAFGVLIFLEHPSNAGDMFYLGLGTQRDIEGDMTTYDPVWLGCGSLQTLLNGGENHLHVTMEDDDFQWPNGGYAHITNKFMTAQTIDGSVNIGDSVQKVVATWFKIAPTADVTYPKGIYVGGNVVLSMDVGTFEEWVLLADNLTTAEVIGTGDGVNPAPVLSTLINVVNGICRQPDKLPVVHADCGGIVRTVYVSDTGVCSGYCSAGLLDMATGVWTTDITWGTAPAIGSVTIDYHENCFSYAGNVATVELESGETVSNAYAIANTFVSGCIDAGDVEPSYDNWVEVSAGSTGTYDEVAKPPLLYCDGTEEDTWVLTFSSGVNFTVSGIYNGSVGTGNVGVNFTPVNPDTGQPFFMLRTVGWGGTWHAGDTITFQTHPAAVPLWLKQVVPPATVAEPNNCVVVGSYSE